MVGNLRNMAIDMSTEVSNQNRQLDRIHDKVSCWNSIECSLIWQALVSKGGGGRVWRTYEYFPFPRWEIQIQVRHFRPNFEFVGHEPDFTHILIFKANHDFGQVTLTGSCSKGDIRIPTVNSNWNARKIRRLYIIIIKDSWTTWSVSSWNVGLVVHFRYLFGANEIGRGAIFTLGLRFWPLRRLQRPEDVQTFNLYTTRPRDSSTKPFWT